MDTEVEEQHITEKQAEVMETVRTAPLTGVEELFLIGPIGSTKTFVMAYAHINCALDYADSIIPVGRKDLSEAQIGTWVVYLEVLDWMGLEEGIDYTTREASNDLRVKFANGSIIQFIGMNKSRDRQWAKLKITSTMAGVDEVDDVDEGGYDVLFSRTGRRNKTGAPRIMISACNPNDAWTKRKIYLPWLKRIGRRLEGLTDEEWDAIVPLSPSKQVIQFDMEDSPLFGTGYYDRFRERPRAWQERFLRNNWNYYDDENSLFKSRTMDILTIRRLKPGEKYLGVDPNAGGKDRASLALWEGDTLVEARVYTTNDLERLAMEDERSPMNYGAILGRLTAEWMAEEGIPASHVGADIVGIGQGWLTWMLANKYSTVKQFRSGDAPIPSPVEIEKNIKPPYGMLRDQMFVLWARDLDNRNCFFYTDMPHLGALKKELMLHEADSTAKVQRVTPKDDIKKLLGASPDIADSAMVGYWVRMISTASSDAASQRATVGKSYEDMYNQGNGF